MGYVSKDFVHEGCALPLQPQLVWEKIPYSVRKNIKKAENSLIKVLKVIGSKEDIDVLRSMWYDPNDPNMPTELTENEFMFIAYDSERIPIGAVILLQVGNHLFLNNLAANSKGKENRAQDYLLWHCVNYFENSQFKYIDVGVSYRPTLYRFFTKWKIWSYPVIFNVPEIKIRIPFYPFNSMNYRRIQENENTLKYFKEILNSDKLTFVPSDEYAITILQGLGHDIIDKSFEFMNIDNPKPYYISLKKLFSVQFGSILVGIEVSDQDMWNKFGCLDIFKRDMILKAISYDIRNLSSIIEKRKENWNKYRLYFELEDIIPEEISYHIPDLFIFKHSDNQRYSQKLNEFEIEHFYDGVKIGLPIHQEITDSQIEYIYAIFRGVLNLCSEWEHTDKYDTFKK